jgi:hypothetical protein
MRDASGFCVPPAAPAQGMITEVLFFTVITLRIRVQKFRDHAHGLLG